MAFSFKTYNFNIYLDMVDKLETIMIKNPAIIGIGNELRGDDGAGIMLVQKLQQKGYHNTIVVFDTPENYLQRITSMPGDARLWVDIINWDSKPGDFKIFLPEEINHFAVSTHNYSPTVLMEYLNELRSVPDYFLGIQPLNLSLGSEISKPVQLAIEQLIKIFDKYID